MMLHNTVVIEFTLVISLACLLQRTGVWCEPSATNWMPNEDSWHYWWSYSGISGPAYWGLLNLDWFICDKGRQQSPIDIETKTLIYDPQLGPLKVDNNLISGLLYNDGHSIVFNGSMSPFILENIAIEKTNQILDNNKQSLNKEKKLNNSISKRSNDIDILSQLNSLLDAESSSSKSTYKDSSTSVLRDLSNSVELSIEQNDRLEPIDGSKSTSMANSADGDTENDSDSGDSGGVNSILVGNNERNSQLEDPTSRIHLTGAGLAYLFRFEILYLRFGLDSKFGSEHRINSHAYAAELQLMAYNSLLYKSFAEASTKPRGLLGVAILIDTIEPSNKTGNSNNNNNNNNNVHQKSPKATNGKSPNSILDNLVTKSFDLKYRGSSMVLRSLNLSALLPETDSFVTYEGSLTTPGCQESVNWLVLNKPLYITQSNLDMLRSISADEQSGAPTGTLIADNIRPVQPTNYRLIRTNIRPSTSSSGENQETCQRLWARYEYKQALQ